MMLKDKVREVEPDFVDEEYIGGVSGCPYDYDYLEGHYVINFCDGYCNEDCYECWSQEYIEEELNCDNCKHSECGMYEEPCNKCRNTAVPYSDEYNNRPFLYEPKYVIDCNDNINHPNHYQGKNECIDVMVAMFGEEAVKHFCMCNAYKYRFRSAMKNGTEDIEKAEWYESKLIELGGIE